MPTRHGLLPRLFVLSVLVSLCSIAATAWITARTTTAAIRQERGGDVDDDADTALIYDTLLGYAATHPDWSGAAETVRSLANRTGRRVSLTTGARRTILDSAPGAYPLPAHALATIDPLSLDLARTPESGDDRIDPRAVGPYAVTAAEHARLQAAAQRLVNCLRVRVGADAVLIDQPNGHPRVDAPGVSRVQRELSCDEPARIVDEPTATERAALRALTPLVDTCLAGRGVGPVTVGRGWTWQPVRGTVHSTTGHSTTGRSTTGHARAGAGGAPARDPTDAPGAVTACLAECRREQLRPYVAGPALLFVTTSRTTVATGFDLSAPNRLRIAGVAGLILLITIAASTVAGMRLVTPLRSLTVAAQRMRDGDPAARAHVRGDDEIGRLAAAFNELAEHRERLEQLRRSMVSDVAHELRTPVSNIRGWLEAAQDGVADLDADLLALLHDEAMLLQHVIEDLRDLASADAGVLRLHRRPVPVGHLLDQVAAAHRAAAESGDVTLTVAAGDGLTLDADPLRLRQAVGNLVSNAIRHTPPGGTVTISAAVGGSGPAGTLGATDPDGPGDSPGVGDPGVGGPGVDGPGVDGPGGAGGPWVVIAVSDTGTGIDADDLPYVFDRFWRAEKSRSRQTGGSGLGLAITRKLVEAHGGRVHATSTPGTGSTFTIVLPGSG